MLVVGLTGSMGMGKSTVAGMLREAGIAVFDADAEVHRLYSGPAVDAVERAFPSTTREGVVDRQLLARALMADPAGYGRLEAIVHPLVRAAERNFLHGEQVRGARLSVLEIPLLYETGSEKLLDAVVVVSASAAVQRARLAMRPGMTDARIDALLARQLPDAEKRRRADFVVDTGATLEATRAAVLHTVEELLRRESDAYLRHWA